MRFRCKVMLPPTRRWCRGSVLASVGVGRLPRLSNDLHRLALVQIASAELDAPRTECGATSDGSCSAMCGVGGIAPRRGRSGDWMHDFIVGRRIAQDIMGRTIMDYGLKAMQRWFDSDQIGHRRSVCFTSTADGTEFRKIRIGIQRRNPYPRRLSMLPAVASIDISRKRRTEGIVSRPTGAGRPLAQCPYAQRCLWSEQRIERCRCTQGERAVW